MPSKYEFNRNRRVAALSICYENFYLTVICIVTLQKNSEFLYKFDAKFLILNFTNAVKFEYFLRFAIGIKFASLNARNVSWKETEN